MAKQRLNKAALISSQRREPIYPVTELETFNYPATERKNYGLVLEAQCESRRPLPRCGVILIISV